MGLATLDPHSQKEHTKIHKIPKFGVNQATMGDKSVETLGSKIRFLSVFVTFPPPLPPKTMLIFRFLRPHRPQRLHNIELGGRGDRELTLDANKIEKMLKYRKASFPKSVSTTFLAHCSFD